MEVTPKSPYEDAKDVFENCFAFLEGSLLKERNSWREQMVNNTFERPHILKEYETHRHSELWRASRQSERILEYVLFLEEKLNELKELL